MHQGHVKGVFAPWVQPSIHLIVFKSPPRCHSILKFHIPSTSNLYALIWSLITLLIHRIYSNTNANTSCVSLGTLKSPSHHMSLYNWTLNVGLILSIGMPNYHWSHIHGFFHECDIQSLKTSSLHYLTIFQLQNKVQLCTYKNYTHMNTSYIK